LNYVHQKKITNILSITAVFHTDKKWSTKLAYHFLKDHVTLKARVMMLKILLCLTDLITFEKIIFTL